MADFWSNIRDAIRNVASPVMRIPQGNNSGNNGGGDRFVEELRKSESSTTMPSGSRRNIEKLPDLVDSNGKRTVWGFEQDKSRYSDINPNDTKATDALTWRDYTVTPKNDERSSKNFSVGYDKNGRIAGVRSKNDNGETYGYYGKDLLKNFFSQFDRDATSYRVWQNETYDNGDGTGRGEASIVFDSDEDNAPFIPSTIFRDRPLRIIDFAPSEPIFVQEPRGAGRDSGTETPVSDEEFTKQWRELQDKLQQMQRPRPLPKRPRQIL